MGASKHHEKNLGAKGRALQPCRLYCVALELPLQMRVARIGDYRRIGGE